MPKALSLPGRWWHALAVIGVGVMIGAISQRGTAASVPILLGLFLGLIAFVALARIAGVPGVVAGLLTVALLPAPVVNVGTAQVTAGIGIAPVMAIISLVSAREVGLHRIPHIVPYLLFLIVGIFSVGASWLFWHPRVATGSELGYGHRSIGYQLAALFFLTVPLLSYIAGSVYSKIAAVEPVYFVGMAGLALVTMVSWISSWGNFSGQMNSILLHGHARDGITYGYAAILTVMSCAVLLWINNRWMRMLAGLALIFGVTTIIVTFFLNAWLGVLIAVIAMIWRRWGQWGVGGVLVLGIVLAVPMHGMLVELVGDRASGSDMDRLGLWQSAVSVWSTSPLIGVGPGNLTSYMEAFSQFSLNLVLQGYQQAHNTFLELLAETGLVGTALFLGFLILVARDLIRKGEDAQGDMRRSAALGLLICGTVMAFFSSGLVPTVSAAGWLSVPPTLIVWFVVGCGVGTNRFETIATIDPNPRTTRRVRNTVKENG